MATDNPILVVEWIISLPHATSMMKRMNIKRHRNAGYFFELIETGLNIWDSKLQAMAGPKAKVYGDYAGGHDGWILKVYRDKA